MEYVNVCGFQKLPMCTTKGPFRVSGKGSVVKCYAPILSLNLIYIKKINEKCVLFCV